MARPELIHYASGSRTKSSQYRSIPSPRNFTGDSSNSPRKTARERLRQYAVIISVILVLALTLWGAVTYYNARRNSPENVLTHSVERIYTVGYQNRAATQIDRKKRAHNYTMNDMLIEANPYGTNTTSLYVYFVTEQPMSVSYTVNAPETDYPAFTRTISDATHRGRTHEFQVIGLIPSTKNIVTFTITDANGNTTTRDYTYDMGDVLGSEPVQVDVNDVQNSGDSVPLQDIGNGLFAVMPQTSGSTNFTFLYDSHGILRGEIPLKNITATRFMWHRNRLYYAISPTQFVAVDRLGRVENFITFDGRYSLASDFTMDSRGNIVAIATNAGSRDYSGEIGNYVVRINILNGKMRVVANLSTILNTYRATTVRSALNSDGTTNDSLWNWLGLNSISMIDDTHILLSSRETSSLLTLDISDSPSVTSILGPASLWSDPEYSYLLISQNGNFDQAAGQSDIQVRNVTSDGYDVTLFNNNFAASPSNPTFSWATAIPTASLDFAPRMSTVHSYAYTYHVNTVEKTYSLTSSQRVDFTPINGNAQHINGKLITTTTQNRSWEASESGMPVTRYSFPSNQVNSASTFTTALYRVQYVPFTDFYFIDK
ncbi:hypothetical protein EJ419_03465 [Alloscardovia theropitheci]|uniref:Arylsulfotransferase N-terminal domain-containing protein n=1 Tax=Alloscardovia theropitheci TaxID=2496842 RepID=A0A4V2MTZ8_9BIFI|nr:aryl-sulfate sulfotransferase [Alloscardovia theropitheci]TCD54439.1 hypothetical protein EJ419_03465 [Alloscardovia theropitheci]